MEEEGVNKYRGGKIQTSYRFVASACLRNSTLFEFTEPQLQVEAIKSNMTTEYISSSQVNDFDYVIVGGGTAGCVIASRLSEYLPQKKILMIEAGPSDFNNDRVLKLSQWLTLLGGDLDYDYGTTEQPNGKCLGM